ncbi:hypothetical protein GQ53DRAFT_778010 [Thozetella sp. PMI_491]|nr:hypothetical protein GQ53DRAFT_778010 [Thozetella sp. PMI_491]
MDAADVFRQVGVVIPRPPPQQFYPRKLPHAPVAHPRLPHPHGLPLPQSKAQDDGGDGDSGRIAHTLTACCRCRQRKTRCDPTLPRCLPCERSGSTCEYYDTTKGKRISRYYVVKLQEKVRQLEADLAQYTEGDEYPRNNEEIVRPGGLVRLSESDETPRYLGPSSGIAMARLLMEEAKRYTDSKRISELVPEVRARRAERLNRMQSIVSMGGSISGPSMRRKSYPMISAKPAEGMPTRQILDKLVEVFNQRVQVFTPTLHEPTLDKDVSAVLEGDNDPYKNFVVRMVMAISLQKLDTQYAGLADGYYQAAMQYFEDVVRPKDLKTLQCLVLVEQYSLLTPTRTAVYYIIGLATRICQQLNLTDEKRISIGIEDPSTLDMRRRLGWIVTTCEFGLAASMGRPNGFSRGSDFMNVDFFASVSDENITEAGIQPGPPSEKKLVAIHYCKMHQLQAEIRRALYEKKRPEPRSETHPWFGHIETKLEEWRDSAPEKPEWCKPWFTGQHYGMIIFLYRPSPQVPRPSSRAALKCFEGAAYIINLSSQQVKKAAVDITWIFLINVYMALNTLLWALSYPEVRAEHPREELEELVNVALDVIEQCSERWPGSTSASQMYAVFAKACMQSYDVKEESPASGPNSALTTPPSLPDTSSPAASEASSLPTSAGSQNQQSQRQGFNAPQFGYVFDATPDQMAVNMDDPYAQNHPTFRSNSIFLNPASNSGERRGSYFAPDFTQPNENPVPEQVDESTPPATTTPQLTQATPPLYHNGQTSPPMPTPGPHMLPTPPESLAAPPSANPSNTSLSPTLQGTGIKTGTPTPTMQQASPALLDMQGSPLPPAPLSQLNLKFGHGFSKVPAVMKQESGMPPSRTPAFTIPPHPQQNAQQRPLPAPTTVTNWFNPPPPFISPYAAFSGVAAGGGNYFGDGNGATSYTGLGLTTGTGGYTVGGGRNGVVAAAPGGGPNGFSMYGQGIAQYSFPPERQGSLSQEQQMELMDVLENQGMQDIDAFLNMGMGLGGSGVDGAVRW